MIINKVLLLLSIMIHVQVHGFNNDRHDNTRDPICK